MEASKKMSFRVWKARDGWRWQIRAKNGRITAESGEAYTRKHDCIRAIRAIQKARVMYE